MLAQQEEAPRKGSPRFDSRPDIRYPMGPRRANVEGETIVLLKVHKSGEVQETNVRSPAILPIFDAATLEGFKDVTLTPFDPKDFDGKEVICVEYAVEFCMEGWGPTAVRNPKCKGGW